MSGSMNINIIDDTVQEHNETFTVTLQLAPSCLPVTLIGENSFNITIIYWEELPVKTLPLIYRHHQYLL